MDEAAWQSVLTHNPSNTTALSTLADISRMQGQHLGAAGYLQRLLEVGVPEDAEWSTSTAQGPMSKSEVCAALGGSICKPRAGG